MHGVLEVVELYVHPVDLVDNILQLLSEIKVHLLDDAIRTFLIRVLLSSGLRPSHLGKPIQVDDPLRWRKIHHGCHSPILDGQVECPELHLIEGVSVVLGEALGEGQVTIVTKDFFVNFKYHAGGKVS